jgi:7-cyano-7-deazaguanine synthase in queuosine biosynthesis
MWSGGLDSTYALAKMLSDTTDEVIAHHVHYLRGQSNRTMGEHRCEYEAQAVHRLLPALQQHYRAFEYTESRLDLSALSCVAGEASMAMFIAAQVALSYGLTPFDRIVLGVNADSDRDWQPQTYAYAFRRSVCLGLLRSVWESQEVPYLYVPNPRPTRAHAYSYLPQNLAALTVSCHAPETGGPDGIAASALVACGECEGCRSRPQPSELPAIGIRSPQQNINGPGTAVFGLRRAKSDYLGPQPQPAV